MIKDMLYAYIEVAVYGYEFTDVAKLSDYKNWDKEHREQAWGDARRRAQLKFDQRDQGD
jgi:hypothetical protein